MSRIHGALPLHDDTPLRKYPLAATYPAAVPSVERTLHLTDKVRRYYVQRGPLCVAYSIDQLMTFHNGSLYHPGWLYYRAGGDGTNGVHTDPALRAALLGNITMPASSDQPAPENDVSPLPGEPDAAIKEFRWLSRDGRQAVDEARSCIADGKPFVFAFGWSNAGNMLHRKVDDRYWLLLDGAVTQPLYNWHQVCITGALDSLDAFFSPNSYGPTPQSASEFHLAYDDFAALIDAGCYGAAITDKVTGTEKPQPVDPPVTAYPCPRCTKSFPTKKKRARHIKRKHR